MNYRAFFWLSLIIWGLSACSSSENHTVTSEALFNLMPASKTGIDFANDLEYSRDFNVYTYRNYYNGGGVAIGDVNNDGLPDIYLTANQKSNKLYLNKGDFSFSDITEKAGVAGQKAWSTGVSMADVNADGFLDIYVCNSGDVEGDNKQNELFINNGDGTFSEQAESYGLADQGFSTHAAFFDYDKDGDLDAYLLNNSYQAIGSFNLRKNERPKRDPVGGDKLYRNDEGKFVDVSEEAGIYGSIIGFGLGVTVGDINQDGWQDIYVSNDFFERDYIYMNNGDGTFTEDLENQMLSISAASMGADMADITGDGYPEIFVTEMLPKTEERFKTTMTFENWDKYQYNVSNGYYHQFTRNMLHLNNSDGTFSEIGRLAGVEATDWSWGALITDFNNDGFKDLYVSNGIYQDILDQDYLNFIANEEVARSIITEDGVDYKKLIDIIPSNPIPNYMFAGNPNFDFDDKTTEWGMATPSHSNGAAYGDLDNDGDLDLVVNNVNMEAFVYRNNANEKTGNNYLKIQLKGEAQNPFALGTTIAVTAGGKHFYLEQMPMRGFQSSMDYRPNFGLGNAEKVDEIFVKWYDGRITMLNNIEVNQTLVIDHAQSTDGGRDPGESFGPIFSNISGQVSLDFEHKENRFVDFDRDRLLYHMLSTEGPKVATADVNGDGLEDVYIGGAKDNVAKLFVQKANGQFMPSNEGLFEADKASEDLGCLFFDANGDGTPDLYVTSGGNEYPATSISLNDRLYINDGKGNFSKKQGILPGTRVESTSTVDAADFDGDGDLDLFVGARVRPMIYGVPVNGFILENDGAGNFKNVTTSVAPELLEIGMITDAKWTDYDLDNDPDLVIVGDWMAIRVFENQNGQLKDQTESAGLAKTTGWWNTVEVADVDNDGDPDIIAGNHGLNSRFKASEEKPISCYINDYDGNGTAEQIISCFNGDASYPTVLRHDLVMQMPHLKKRYLKYENYKGQTVEDIFTPEELANAVVHEVYQLESVILLNQGDGTFAIKSLPVEAQFAPIYGMLVKDLDGDDQVDILLGGNLYGAKPEVGRYDASYGLYLKGDGKGAFTTWSADQSGFRLKGEIRDFASLNVGGQEVILVARNNDAVAFYQALLPSI